MPAFRRLAVAACVSLLSACSQFPASGPNTKTIQENPDIRLRVDKTGTLKVKVYLPDERGNSSGVLAPLVTIKVTQGVAYVREAQVAGIEAPFTRMLANLPFTVTATELGGEGRIAQTGGSFPAGSFETSASLVFPTSGTVEVHVTADFGPSPAGTIRGNISSA